MLWFMCSDGGPRSSFFTGDGSSSTSVGAAGVPHNAKASAACEKMRSFLSPALEELGDGEGVSVRLKD